MERVQYDVFGRPDFQNPNGKSLDRDKSIVDNPYLFQGRRWDGESKLYYYRNRYFDPGKGRFITRDPMGIWGDINNYGNEYVLGRLNSLINLDPKGLQQDHEGTAICQGSICGPDVTDVLVHHINEFIRQDEGDLSNNPYEGAQTLANDYALDNMVTIRNAAQRVEGCQLECQGTTITLCGKYCLNDDAIAHILFNVYFASTYGEANAHHAGILNEWMDADIFHCEGTQDIFFNRIGQKISRSITHKSSKWIGNTSTTLSKKDLCNEILPNTYQYHDVRTSCDLTRDCAPCDKELHIRHHANLEIPPIDPSF